MKALVKREAAPGIWLEEVALPVMDSNDVLIKIKKTSVCGTDLHIYNWDQWSKETIRVPLVIGHEFVGEVVDYGENVKDVCKGDLVSGEGHLVCGSCRNCLAGRRHLCNSTSSVGVNRPGAFAEYLSIPVTNVWHCDPSIPLDVLSCFDPFGNATHTALSFDLLGEDVLITGAGPIGIMAALVARHAGARFVVITDINPYRLALAEKVGVTRAVNPRQMDLKTVARQLGMKEGFDVGMEMSGSASALREMISVMCHGGKIVLLGIQQPETEIDFNDLIFKGLTIKGIYGREMYETWYKMTSMVQSGLDISPVITHHFKYTDYQKAFEIMASGESGKVILDWE